MALPTKAQWSTLKSNAGIAKSPWYKLADAAVGPALAGVESAKKKWEAEKDDKTATSYILALDKLDKAFQKFVNKKDLTAAGPLGNQIMGWKTEIATEHTTMVAKLPALIKEYKDKMMNTGFGTKPGAKK